MRQPHIRDAKRDDADLAGLVLFILLAVVFIFVALPWLVANPLAAAALAAFAFVAAMLKI